MGAGQWLGRAWWWCTMLAARITPSGVLGASGLRLHVLPSGSVYDPRSGAATLDARAAERWRTALRGGGRETGRWYTSCVYGAASPKAKRDLEPVGARWPPYPSFLHGSAPRLTQQVYVLRSLKPGELIARIGSPAPLEAMWSPSVTRGFASWSMTAVPVTLPAAKVFLSSDLLHGPSY